MSNETLRLAEEQRRDSYFKFEQLQLEREKVQLERDKLKVERDKAKWTSHSILASVVVALVTIGGGIITQYQQAKSQFDIKAAEIVMNTDSANQARDTANALLAIFPDRLPSNFAESFQPEKHRWFGRDIVTAKIELLRSLPGKKQKDKEEIIELWKKLFPEDFSFERERSSSQSE